MGLQMGNILVILDTILNSKKQKSQVLIITIAFPLVASM